MSKSIIGLDLIDFGIRIADCGLQIEISNMSRIQNPKSAFRNPKSYVLQEPMNPNLRLDYFDIAKTETG
jgi:hypothetical protein